MAFVEVEKFPGVTTEDYEKLMEAAYGGTELLDGQLFFAVGTAGDTLYYVDAWDSREKCDAAMEKMMAAVPKVGISLDNMSHEEFELYDLKVGTPALSA
jgi:hypothetical protein